MRTIASSTSNVSSVQEKLHTWKAKDAEEGFNTQNKIIVQSIRPCLHS